MCTPYQKPGFLTPHVVFAPLATPPIDRQHVDVVWRMQYAMLQLNLRFSYFISVSTANIRHPVFHISRALAPLFQYYMQTYCQHSATYDCKIVDELVSKPY